MNGHLNIHDRLFETNYVTFFSRKAILKCCFENVCTDDALSKENMGM